ncbi:MFS transporter [Vaginisenegalia massiliensis]|uniref:MFS transporter n=1 Tax=Vaginisenegalia massiliensis TaxID=2058294 RepID=UPI0013DDFA20|nr:MFS transporter [Vaginisenegalia massiliensis]
MERNKRLRASLTLFILMFSVAFVENIKGVIIPQIKASYHLNATNISFMLTLSALAYVGATYLAGEIIESFGRKWTEALGIGLAALGCAIMGFSPSFSIFILGMIILNIGFGFNGVIINVVMPAMFVTYQSIAVNGVHFMYGFGATVGQRLAGYLIGQGWTFSMMYRYLMGIMAVLALLACFIYYPKVNSDEAKESSAPPLNPYRQPYFWLFVSAMSLYVFAETGLGNWLVDYLKVTQKMGENQGSQYIATFFMLLALGRLMGGWVVDRLGKLRSIIGGSIIGSVLIVVGILLKGPGYYCVSLAGLFYSIVFPTSVLMISQVFKHRVSYMTSKILTLTFAGSMILNQLVGWVTDQLGFNWSIYMMPVAGLTAAVIYLVIQARLQATKY